MPNNSGKFFTSASGSNHFNPRLFLSSFLSMALLSATVIIGFAGFTQPAFAKGGHGSSSAEIIPEYLDPDGYNCSNHEIKKSGKTNTVSICHKVTAVADGTAMEFGIKISGTAISSASGHLANVLNVPLTNISDNDLGSQYFIFDAGFRDPSPSEYKNITMHFNDPVAFAYSFTVDLTSVDPTLENVKNKVCLRIEGRDVCSVGANYTLSTEETAEPEPSSEPSDEPGELLDEPSEPADELADEPGSDEPGLEDSGSGDSESGEPDIVEPDSGDPESGESGAEEPDSSEPEEQESTSGETDLSTEKDPSQDSTSIQESTVKSASEPDQPTVVIYQITQTSDDEPTSELAEEDDPDQPEVSDLADTGAGVSPSLLAMSVVFFLAGMCALRRRHA